MRGYFVYDIYERLGVAVVARSAKEAKKIGYNSLESMYGTEWIEAAVTWVKDANISGICEPTELSLVDGLRRGIFAQVEGVTCETCGKKSSLCEMRNGKIACLDCIEEQEGVLECV